MILIILFFTIIIMAIAYILLLTRIKTSWDQSKAADEIVVIQPISPLKVSVIIAARNEATSIDKCLKSIINNDYRDAQGIPLYEIIVIDDHSTDNTADIISSFITTTSTLPTIKTYSLPDEIKGKKAALTFAIVHASHPIILCTDADCTVANTWISDQVQTLTMSKASAQGGLVYMKDDQTLLTRFQMMDYLATMAITNHGYQSQQFHLANGANLCYYKAAFEAVGGYEGNAHIASGDDVFLMQKIVQNHQVSFLKNTKSVVYTKPERTWSALWHQRKRWATKATVANNSALNSIQGFVFIYCLTIVIATIIGLISYPILFFGGLIALFIKIGMDYLFLSSLAKDYDSKPIMKSFPISFILYFFHILSSGWFAIIKGKYQWKDRSTQ